jgi:holo-[acyl-carrier protein] synthase
MIEGIGIDLIEIKRIENIVCRQKRFPERILTEKELKIYESMKPARQIEFLAGRYAAKEAYAKAVGTGIGKHLSWRDIEITVDDTGRPIMAAKGRPDRIHVSITHTRAYAAAEVIIESL